MRRKVLVDLHRLRNPNSGLGRVAWGIAKELEKFPDGDGDIEFVFLLHGKTKNNTALQTERISLIRKYMPFFCVKYDLWHAIHQSSRLMPNSKKDLYIVTIHDLIFLHDKTRKEANKRLKKLQSKINRASAVVFISKFTEKEVLKHLIIPKNTLTRVVYNGVEDTQEIQVQKPAFFKGNKFLFAIAEITSKKNFAVLLSFIEKLPDYNLIIAGSKKSSYAMEMEAKIKELNLTDRVIMPGMISEREKYFLYQECEAFLFPSLFEGFGLPIIEAMRFGKPVFLSESSCLPEIGGKHAFYWTHFESQYMKDLFLEKMELFKGNKHLKKEMITYSESFSWERNVREYISLYKEILKKHNRMKA